ncbi:ROK family transcriptional regulator [soil metagenome]
MADEITSPLRPQLLGRMTQRAVVEALKHGGPMSRADISRITGISPTTVSSAVVQVLKAGFVEETDAEISGPGRPGKILRLASETVQVLGISLEPEWCEMAVGGLDGNPHAQKAVRFPTPNTYPRLLAEIERHARRWIDSPGVRTLGVGLSLPGVVDLTSEQSAFSPNFHQTDGQRPGRDLAERLGVSTTLVQESDALCLAERRIHAVEDLAVLHFVGGLGFGRLINGKLLNHSFGMPNELGHITVIPNGLKCGCGNFGCLETIATDVAFARLVSDKMRQALTVDEAFAAVKDQRVDAETEIEAVLGSLAIAVAAVRNLFSPPLIVLHGRLLHLAPDMLTRLELKARALTLAPFRDRCKLALSHSTKAEGALAGILDHLFEELGPQLPTTPA